MRIAEPRWTRPAWARPAGPLAVVASGQGRVKTVRLVREDGDLALGVESWAPLGGGKWARLDCRAPEKAPEGLWGLWVERESGAVFEPNCVCVERSALESFTFCHTTDLHLVSVKDGRLADRRPLAEAIVERINALSPAFVLDTGDIVSRHGVGNAKLSDDLIWWQAQEARRIFLKLKRPVFLAPGNHDLAFEASRSAWRRHMGGPWDGDRDDYAFDYAGRLFVAVDGTQRCDETTLAKMPAQRPPEQLEWLRRTLRAAVGRPRAVFSHYDYSGALEEALRAEGCDLFLFGHVARPPGGKFPWAVGHLGGGRSLALWRAQGRVAAPASGFALETVFEDAALATCAPLAL